MNKKIGIIIFVSAGFLFGCNNKQKNENQQVQQTPIEFRKDAEIILIKAEGDTLRELNIEVADDDYQRETGLMYRDKMETDQGMLFVFPNEEERGFYMKNTLIPLDLVYFRADSTALSIHTHTQPRDETTLPSNGPAQFVLEVNAGLLERWEFEVGDKFSIRQDTN